MIKKTLVLLSLLLVALTGCGSSGVSKGAVVSPDGLITQWPHGADRGAPIDLSGATLEGKQVLLNSYRGKVTVINIWGSWCGPCRAEAPMLREVYAMHTANFIGINVRDSSADQGLAFEQDLRIPYPSFYSPDGSKVLAFNGAFASLTIPATIVLDPQGRVAAVVRGTIPSATTLKDIIEDAAKVAA